MTITANDLGLLGSLGTALGFFDSHGDPEPGWLGNPGDSLSTVLVDDGQREALMSFVDEALGGADRTTESGVVCRFTPIIRTGRTTPTSTSS